MKKILLVSGLTIQSLVLFAQQPIHTNAKVSGIAQRVIAESDYLYNTPGNPYMQDSVHYKYSGNRGSIFRSDKGKYDYVYPSKLLGFQFEIDTGDFAHADVMADSIDHWSSNLYPGTFGLHEQYAISYLGDKVLSFYTNDLSSSNYGTRQLNAYDAQGLLTSYITQTFNFSSNSWKNFEQVKFTHNADKTISTDSLLQWSSTSQTWHLRNYEIYTYNTTGQITLFSSYYAPNTTETWRYEFGYYPNGKLQRLASWSSYSGQPFVIHSIDTFEYTSGMTTKLTYDVNVIAPSYYKQVIMHNAQNLPDTDTRYGFDSSSMSYKMANQYVWYYLNDLPIKFEHYGLSNSNQMYLNNAHYFYYENYNTTTVATTPKPASIRLYPNPTANNLNLEWQEGVGKQATISITNTTGQLLRSESFTWMQPKETISLQSLASGSYFIRVADAQGAVIFCDQFFKE